MQDQRQDEENQHHNPQADKEQHTNGATNKKCNVIKQAYVEICDKGLGKVSSKSKDWITSNTWKKMDERRELEEKLN